jgi:hypothetical protein
VITVQKAVACAAGFIACLLAAAYGAAQTAKDTPGAAPGALLQNEPPARIAINPPLAEALSRGAVVIRYSTENLRPAPVFGPAALAVSPRVGHVHVNVDDAPWVWADASGEPVNIVGLTPGPHRVRIQLVNANHQRLDESAVRFTVPETRIAVSAAVESHRKQAPARIITDPPLPEPLSRGVVFIRYRTEIPDIIPVSGPAAAAVTPRTGHVRVTADEAEWHWTDASGNRVIVQGLAPGSHKILIELASANHEVVDQKTVHVTVPAPNGPRETKQ